MAAPLYGSEAYVKYFFTNDATIADRPTEWEISLHTGDPGTGNANESTGGYYSRQELTFEAYEAPIGGPTKYFEAQSVGDVVFEEGGPGDDELISHYVIRDKTSGEALAVAKLAVPIPVKTGTVIIFPANYIKVRGV